MDTRKILLIALFIVSGAFIIVISWYQHSGPRMSQTPDSLALRQRQTRDMFASDLPRESLDAIKSAVGGDFKVMELDFADELVSVVVSTDGQSAHKYTLFRGKEKVDGPEDVMLMGDNPLTDSLYDLKQADLSLMPKLAKEALERAKLEGAKVTRMTFKYPLKYREGGTPEWTVYIERGSFPSADYKYVTFDAKGSYKLAF